MIDLGHALTALEAELERGRLALDAAAPVGREPLLIDDIRAMLGALHHLVRRYHDIIDARDDQRARTSPR